MNDEINELVQTAVESITAEMARAFDVIWSREDAPHLVEGFLAGNVAFQVTRNGVTILAADDAEGVES